MSRNLTRVLIAVLALMPSPWHSTMLDERIGHHIRRYSGAYNSQ